MIFQLLFRDGDRLRLDKNTNITVLGPKTDILSNLSSSENDLSLVLRLDYFNKSILFTGDIEKVGEDSILQDLGPVDFF